MRYLSQLSLSDNELTSIPDSVDNLSGLVFLHVNKNQLRTLPESIKNLIKLRCLDIRSNKFESLPPHLADLPEPSLEKMDTKTLQDFLRAQRHT